MESKSLEQRVADLEKNYNWLEGWVRRIVNALRAAKGQLRNIGETEGKDE